MKRTAYFNATKPSQDQLNYTETSKTNAILERARSFSQFGVLTGFRVTVNGLNTTRIDIGVGEGYTGGYYLTSNLVGSGTGERIATNDGSYTATATSLALADYTNGAVNYVSLVFSETSSELLTERSYPFASHATKYEDTFSTSVLTAIGWAALSTTQKQNMILVAKVTARGVGAALSSTDIEQITQPKTHPIATQPSLVSGTTIQGVSETTPTGSAYLYFVAASKTMRFKAPTDTVGASVPIVGSGEYTIYSNNTSYYLVVNVVYALLPIIDRTDTIDITSLYGRTLPLASAADSAHRDLTGSGLVTAKNPHGTALTDIQGGALSHAELFHLNGITHEADVNQLSGTILPATDSIEVTNLGGTSNTFLIGGTEYETITGYTAGTSGQITLAGEVTSGDYLIYLDSAARLQRVLLADYAGGFDYVLWTDKIALYDMFNTSVGTGIISWNATTKVLRYQSPADNGGAGYGPDVYINARWGSVVSGYYTLFSGGLIDWVIVYVSDDLGITASSTFTTGKTESAQPDDAILKLGVVTWRADTGNLVVGSYRDIRSFFTADNTMEFLSEHDENGLHTKELRNQLRVGVKNNAFQAIVETSSAGFFQARSGSVALSVSAPTSAAMIAVSKNAAATVYGVMVTASNNQNNAAAVPVGIYALATNTATALGIGLWGSGAYVGIYGAGDVAGVGASGSTWGVSARGATAVYAVMHGAASSLMYGVDVSPSDIGVVTKSRVCGFRNSFLYDPAASISEFYGYIDRLQCGKVSNAFGIDVIMSVGTASVDLYGIYSDVNCSAVENVLFGLRNGVIASTVVAAQCGLVQYISNSVTCPIVAGISQTMSLYDAGVVYGIYNIGGGDPVGGKVATANAQYNSISVRNPNTIRGWFGNQSAVDCSVFAGGIENTMHYATAVLVHGAQIEADGASAATAKGLNVSNAVTTSCGAGIYGIGNTLRFLGVGGGVATPPIVRGIDQTMVVSRGVELAGMRMTYDVAQVTSQFGYVNAMYAASAASQYGIWNSVGNNAGAAVSWIVGAYNYCGYVYGSDVAGIMATANGSSAVGARAAWLYNVVTTSADYCYGIEMVNEFKGIGMAPQLVYGMRMVNYASRGAEAGGIHIDVVASSVPTVAGFAAHVAVATANSVYGLWTSVSVGVGGKRYGVYAAVSGDDASVVGGIFQAYNVNGFIPATGLGVDVSGPAAHMAIGIAATGTGALYGMVAGHGFDYGAWFSGASNAVRFGKPNYYDFQATAKGPPVPAFGNIWLEATVNLAGGKGGGPQRVFIPLYQWV
jgi:hypothetical protein